MQVAKLTLEQKELLVGQQFADGSFFNPVQDANGTWIISLEEVQKATIPPSFQWVQELPLIEYVPPVYNI